MSITTLQLGAFCHNISKVYRVDRERVQALERVSTGAHHRCMLVQATRRTARLATVPVKMAE
jgi:hypothetical protein